MTATSSSGSEEQKRASVALLALAAANVELASVLAGVTAVVAEEALQNPQFSARLTEVLLAQRGTVTDAASPAIAPEPSASASGRGAPKAKPRRGRRNPGPWDPFSVYASSGEAGLREQLGRLELEQLRDIIAEHGMNSDGLAMRWTKSDRVVGRIVERVILKAAKGDAFRTA